MSLEFDAPVGWNVKTLQTIECVICGRKFTDHVSKELQQHLCGHCRTCKCGYSWWKLGAVTIGVAEFPDKQTWRCTHCGREKVKKP